MNPSGNKWNCLIKNFMVKVFSEMDFLGWYSTGAGEKPTSAEISVHRQIMDINESPLYLQLSPGKRGHLLNYIPRAQKATIYISLNIKYIAKTSQMSNVQSVCNELNQK